MLNWFKKIPKPIWIFTAVWFVLGLIQAAFMDLHPDEAYYWQMSRIMDWGYFHQPPMIAVFIKIGYALFQNELGVRLMTIIASSLGILMLFNLSERKSPKTFILIFLGFILTHTGVFMAVPDSPLIFFSLVFLILLREYLKKDKLLTAIGLGIIAAALMYSKYHAIVLIGSVLLAVPKLLLRKSFWITTLTGIVIFLPHVLWQFDHDLVSFKYHWIVRNKATWTPDLIVNYLTSELILLGPVGLLLIWQIARSRMRNEFQRALVFVMVGFFGFFFLLSFKARVEANWTATAFLPLIILGSNAISDNSSFLRIFKPIALIAAVVLFVGRIYLMTPMAGVGIKLNFPMVGWTNWAKNIKEKANGKPVVFVSSYQLPSQYTFYSGEQGYQFDSFNGDGSQFGLWNLDDSIQGTDFVLALPYGDIPSKAVESENFSPIYLWEMQDYHSYRNLRFVFSDSELRLKPNETVELSGHLMNNTGEQIQLDSLLEKRRLTLLRYKNKDISATKDVSCNGCNGLLKSGESKPVSIEFKAPTETGSYLIRFGLNLDLGLAEQNSDYIPLEITQ